MAVLDWATTKRLIVQGTTIVLSILLAFAIDAWWDERQERAEEQEILESLYAEFQENRIDAASVIATHETHVQKVTRLIDMESDDILSLPAHSIADTIMSLGAPRTFDAITASLDALVGAGKLGIIRDRELRESLTSFANLVEDLQEDAYYLSQGSLAVWDGIVRNGGPWQSRMAGLAPEACEVERPPPSCYIAGGLNFLPVATGQDLLRIKEDRLLMGNAKMNKRHAVIYSSEIRRIVLQIDLILEVLESNL